MRSDGLTSADRKTMNAAAANQERPQQIGDSTREYMGLIIDEQSYIHLENPTATLADYFNHLSDQDTIYPEDSISLVNCSRSKRIAPQPQKIMPLKTKRPSGNIRINTNQRLSLKPNLLGLGIFRNEKTGGKVLNKGDRNSCSEQDVKQVNRSKYFVQPDNNVKEPELDIRDLDDDDNDNVTETDFDQMSRHQQQLRLQALGETENFDESLSRFTKSMAGIALSKPDSSNYVTQKQDGELETENECTFSEIVVDSFQLVESIESGSGLYTSSKKSIIDIGCQKPINVPMTIPLASRGKPTRHTSLPTEYYQGSKSFAQFAAPQPPVDKYEFFRISQTETVESGGDTSSVISHFSDLYDPNKVRLKADIGICQNEMILSKRDVWRPRKL